MGVYPWGEGAGTHPLTHQTRPPCGRTHTHSEDVTVRTLNSHPRGESIGEGA